MKNPTSSPAADWAPYWGEMTSESESEALNICPRPLQGGQDEIKEIKLQGDGREMLSVSGLTDEHGGGDKTIKPKTQFAL